MSDKRLRVWMMPLSSNSRTLQFYSEAYEKYGKPYTNIDIEWTIIPWNAAWNEYVNAFKNGRGPDVFQVGSTWLGAMAQLGFLAESPDEYPDKQMVAPWLSDILVNKGKKIAVPWTVEINLMYARKDILEKHDLQVRDIDNWDKLLDACRRIAVRSKPGADPMQPIPYAMGCRPDMSTLHQVVNWLRGAGWRMPDFSSPGMPILDTAEARIAFSYINELCRTSEHYVEFARISPNRIGLQFYQEGRLAFLLDYAWPILSKVLNGEGRQALTRYPVDILPIPAGPKGFGCRGGASVLCVNANSTNREAAWEFIQYLTGDESMNALSLEAGHIPAFDCDFWERHSGEPVIQLVRNMVEQSFTYPPHALQRSVEFMLCRGVNELFWHMVEYGSFDSRASEIAKRTDQEINRLIELSWGI